MSEKEHFLLGDYRWSRPFPAKGSLHVETRLPIPGEKDLTLWWDSHCREVIIYWCRDLFRNTLVKTELTEPGIWPRKRVLKACPEFTEPLVISAPVRPDRRYLPAVVDLITRIPLLLLDPKPLSKIYRTVKPPQNVDVKDKAWTQVGSYVIYHPALLSTALGLFRQAIVLVHQGLAKEVLKTVNLRQVRETLNQANQEQALHLLEQIRPWIEVPPLPRLGPLPIPGYFPFPWVPEKELRDLSWNRLFQLHRAIKTCGLEPIFGTFDEGWALQTETGQGAEHSGACSFWGSLKRPSRAHKRLENLVNSL